jgi:DnaK suppressor protein
VDIDAITRRLRAEEEDAATRLERAREQARQTTDEGLTDAGDLSVETERRDSQLRSVESAQTHLENVRAALGRIEAGIYGLCAVDGEPIEPKRLEAVPWTTYCLKHQALREEGRADTPTL